MWGSDRSQAADPACHAVPDDHVTRIQTTHAVSNNVNFLLSFDAQHFVHFSAEIFGPPLDTGGKTYRRMIDIKSI